MDATVVQTLTPKCNQFHEVIVVKNVDSDQDSVSKHVDCVKVQSEGGVSVKVDDSTADKNQTADLEKIPYSKLVQKMISFLLTALLMGITFGIAMERGQVTPPITIRKQFLFQRFIMMKMFLSACLCGTICFSILSLLAPTRFDPVRSKFMSSRAAKGLLPVAVGTFMLGCGMAICGACPGMVYIQLGAGVPNAGLTLLGGFIGALSYGLLQPFISSFLSLGLSEKQKIDDFDFVSKRQPKYWQLGFILAACLALPIALFEHFMPWQSSNELAGSASSSYEPWTQIWLPELSGIIVGSLQIPAVLLTAGTVGSSSTYMTTVAQMLLTSKLQERFKHLNSFRNTLTMWQGVFYIWCAALGSYIASSAGGTFGSSRGVSPGAAVVGGFVMLFGSRMAGGCTSGHGLSGFPLLSVQSIIAVPAMFAGGIVTAFVYQAVDSSAFLGSLE